jgi:hypothetical protein
VLYVIQKARLLLKARIQKSLQCEGNKATPFIGTDETPGRRSIATITQCGFRL